MEQCLQLFDVKQQRNADLLNHTVSRQQFALKNMECEHRSNLHNYSKNICSRWTSEAQMEKVLYSMAS